MIKILFKLFCILCVICMVSCISDKNKETEPPIKVVMVIVDQFEDIEFFGVKEILENSGVEVIIASTDTAGEINSVNGQSTKADIKISDMNTIDFTAIVITGGYGVKDALWDNEELRNYIISAYNSGKYIAAMCAAPPILAKAGLLIDKNATMFPWDEGIKVLTNNGAKYTDELPVVVEGNIITGGPPETTVDFGIKIVEILGL